MTPAYEKSKGPMIMKDFSQSSLSRSAIEQIHNNPSNKNRV
jgi:hypothetical protein